MMNGDIETVNDCLVGVCGGGVVIILPQIGPMPKDKALRLAAWLVALAEETPGEFEMILNAVRCT